MRSRRAADVRGTAATFVNAEGGIRSREYELEANRIA